MSTFVANSLRCFGWTNSLISQESFRALGVNGLVVGCLTVLLTVSDAFETGNLGIVHRATLWVVVSLLLVVQLTGLKYLLQKLLSSVRPAFVLAVPTAIAVTVGLMAIELHWLKYTPLLPKQPDPFFEFLLFLTPPLSAVAALVLLAQHLSQQSRPQPSTGSSDNEQKLSQAVAEEAIDMTWIVQNHTVKHVQVDDHYLMVNCSEHKLLVRARMLDALACLESADGIQVHRSHWVAKDFIKSCYRDGRDCKLLLNDGTVVPVARSRIKQIRFLLQNCQGCP